MGRRRSRAGFSPACGGARHQTQPPFTGASGCCRKGPGWGWPGGARGSKYPFFTTFWPLFGRFDPDLTLGDPDSGRFGVLGGVKRQLLVRITHVLCPLGHKTCVILNKSCLFTPPGTPKWPESGSSRVKSGSKWPKSGQKVVKTGILTPRAPPGQTPLSGFMGGPP